MNSNDHNLLERNSSKKQMLQALTNFDIANVPKDGERVSTENEQYMSFRTQNVSPRFRVESIQTDHDSKTQHTPFIIKTRN